jgi:hypothetical protein
MRPRGRKKRGSGMDQRLWWGADAGSDMGVEEAGGCWQCDMGGVCVGKGWGGERGSLLF